MSNELAEVVQQIKQLQAIIAAMPVDSPAYTNMQEALLWLKSRISSGPLITDPIRSERDTIIGGSQTIVNISQKGNDQSDLKMLVKEYLRRLSADCNRLVLSDLDSVDPSRAAIDLATIYTHLEVNSTTPLSSREKLYGRRPRHYSVFEVVTIHHRLVLLGDPGSGKSSFANYTCLGFAQMLLGSVEWRDRFAALGYQKPKLPIRIILSDLAHWLAQRGSAPKESLNLFWEWLQHLHGVLLAGILRKYINQGAAIIFFDGLDEVTFDAEGQPFGAIKAVIESVGAIAGNCQIVVTCRTLDYSHPQRRLPTWFVEVLKPFSEQQQHDFITRWYKALVMLRRPINGNPQQLCSNLQSEIQNRTELRRISGNPLLLTIMSLLHAYDGGLPAERVRLYSRCIEILVQYWRAKPGEPSLRQRLNLSNWQENDIYRILDRLGYVAHKQASDRDREDATYLHKPVFIETVRTFFSPYGADRDYERAQIFCTYISRHSNGVIQEYGPEIYRFWHRTFQEFLAARRLIADEDWPLNEAEFVERAIRRLEEGPHWRQVVLLAASQQVIINNQISPVVLLASELLARTTTEPRVEALNTLLAGEVLIEVGRERLARLSIGLSALKIWERVVELMEHLLLRVTSHGNSVLSNEERVYAGFVLGRLGDPRIDLRREDYWCRIPEGSFSLGGHFEDRLSLKWEHPLKHVHLPAFCMAKYPITNAQWRLFMEDNGYDNPIWWADSWNMRTEHNWHSPQFWEDVRLNTPNQPVVGVSWYEAQAFCRWLSAQQGYEIVLPTEAEWEKAMRGTDGRSYPWGNRWSDDRANTYRNKVGSTTPVGVYPGGASPYGVLDGVGNIFEWTATPWSRNYAQTNGTLRVANDILTPVIRGGSWAYNALFSRCSYRRRTYANRRLADLGFRIMTFHIQNTK